MMISTLRPGLLVALSTTIRGNVAYRTVDIETDHLTDEGQRRARWETERTIEDPAEHEAAVKVRSKCRSTITAVCAGSDFGLLCPESKRDALAAAVEEARRTADAFNATAKRTRVSVYVITGRIAADDVEAVRAINSEIASLVATMESGIRSLDVKAVRDAANRARDVASMLAPEAAAKVANAIEEARAAARRIVKAGEQAAVEVSTLVLSNLQIARTAFLDLDPAREVAPATLDGRAVDLAPETPSVQMEAAPVALDLSPIPEVATPAPARPVDFEV
jgi:hypothetical protein